MWLIVRRLQTFPGFSLVLFLVFLILPPWEMFHANTQPAFALFSAYMSEKIESWNANEFTGGTIFWPPATQPGALPLNTYADEVASVLGRPPAFTCHDDKLLKMQINGRLVETVENVGGTKKFKLVNPTNAADIVHLESYDKCDKPSMAADVTYCSTSSRLGQYQDTTNAGSNVTWIILCRKSPPGGQTVRADRLDADGNDYWAANNYEVDLLGYIGYNNVTGETAFFDSNIVQKVDVEIKPPGGSGYSDAVRANVTNRWSDVAAFAPCPVCHTNNDPWIVTPYIEEPRVRGYAPSIIPDETDIMPRPYRVVGTEFATLVDTGIRDFYHLNDPGGRCNDCHTMTGGSTADSTMQNISRDATAFSNRLQPNAPAPDEGRLWQAALNTQWTRENMHHWMGGNAYTVAQRDALDGCLDDPSTCRASNAGTELKVYTQCVAPESTTSPATRAADTHAPSNFAADVEENRDGDNPDYPHEITAKWKYYNGFGEVPTRDDVRFDLAIRAVDMSGQSGAWPPPTSSDYPDPSGMVRRRIGGGTPGGLDTEIVEIARLLTDIAYWEHWEYTDPTPTNGPRDYQVSFPARCHHRYLFNTVPKRFCFDAPGAVKYSQNTAGHKWYVDVMCDDEDSGCVEQGIDTDNDGVDDLFMQECRVVD